MNFSSEKNVIESCKYIVDNCLFTIPEESKKGKSINKLLRNKFTSKKYIKFELIFEEHININYISNNTSIHEIVNKNIVPDIIYLDSKNNKNAIIEVKKINTNQDGSDYPYLFTNDKNRLLRTNFYELGQSMLLNHKGFEIITH